MSNLTKENLYDLYWNQEKSEREIAKELNCTRGKIRYNLDKYKIKRRNRSNALKGDKNGMFGKTHMKEVIQKIISAQKQIIGEKRHNWKGNDVKYFGLHGWLRRNIQKPKKCENCNKETNKLELSNISGKYKRDPNDYRYLCRKCHHFKDIELHPRDLETGQFIKNEVFLQ